MPIKFDVKKPDGQIRLVKNILKAFKTRILLVH